jgi:hypothetical protein
MLYMGYFHLQEHSRNVSPWRVAAGSTQATGLGQLHNPGPSEVLGELTVKPIAPEF